MTNPGWTGIVIIAAIVSFPVALSDSHYDEYDVEDGFYRERSTSTTPVPVYPDGVNTIPGQPEINYPIYGKIFRTSFTCVGRLPGFYADLEARCQIWHTCDTEEGLQSFLCTNGTIFSQETRVCEWWYNTACSAGFIEQNVDRNQDLYQTGTPKDNQDNEESFRASPRPIRINSARPNSNPSQEIKSRETNQGSRRPIEANPYQQSTESSPQFNRNRAQVASYQQSTTESSSQFNRNRAQIAPYQQSSTQASFNRNPLQPAASQQRSFVNQQNNNQGSYQFVVGPEPTRSVPHDFQQKTTTSAPQSSVRHYFGDGSSNDQDSRSRQTPTNQRGENQRGENQRGENQRGENQRGENQRGENQRGENQRGENQRGENQRRGQDVRGELNPVPARIAPESQPNNGQYRPEKSDAVATRQSSNPTVLQGRRIPNPEESESFDDFHPKSKFRHSTPRKHNVKFRAFREDESQVPEETKRSRFPQYQANDWRSVDDNYLGSQKRNHEQLSAPVQEPQDEYLNSYLPKTRHVPPVVRRTIADIQPPPRTTTTTLPPPRTTTTTLPPRRTTTTTLPPPRTTTTTLPPRRTTTTTLPPPRTTTTTLSPPTTEQFRQRRRRPLRTHEIEEEPIRVTRNRENLPSVQPGFQAYRQPPHTTVPTIPTTVFSKLITEENGYEVGGRRRNTNEPQNAKAARIVVKRKLKKLLSLTTTTPVSSRKEDIMDPLEQKVNNEFKSKRGSTAKRCTVGGKHNNFKIIC